MHERSTVEPDGNMSAHANEAQGRHSVLVFRVEDVWLAVQATLVDEIGDRMEPMPLPRAPQHIGGLVSIRGEAVPLLRLGSFLGFSSTAAGAGALEEDFVTDRVIVLSAADMRVGFPCYRILGVFDVSGKTREAATTIGQPVNEFALSEFDLPVGLVTELDVNKLLSVSRVES